MVPKFVCPAKYTPQILLFIFSVVAASVHSVLSSAFSCATESCMAVEGSLAYGGRCSEFARLVHGIFRWKILKTSDAIRITYDRTVSCSCSSDLGYHCHTEKLETLAISKCWLNKIISLLCQIMCSITVNIKKNNTQINFIFIFSTIFMNQNFLTFKILACKNTPNI